MFCPKCGSIMLTNKCSCGYKNKEGTKIQLTENTNKKIGDLAVVDPEQEEKTMPVANIECPKCGHNKAYHWEVQTRAGDEPATKFFKCVKCKGTWRDYS